MLVGTIYLTGNRPRQVPLQHKLVSTACSCDVVRDVYGRPQIREN